LAIGAFYPAYNSFPPFFKNGKRMSQFTSSRLRVADLPQNRETAFSLAPDTAQMTAISQELDLLSLRKLRFEGQVVSEGKSDWRLEAELGATVVQPCVVTLAPVTTRIEVSVIRRFLAHLPEDTMEESEVELPEDETIEKLGSEIDLENVMIEALSFALPLYPRAEGAELSEAQFTEPGKKPMSDGDAHPFAELQALRDKLPKKG